MKRQLGLHETRFSCAQQELQVAMANANVYLRRLLDLGWLAVLWIATLPGNIHFYFNIDSHGNRC